MECVTRGLHSLSSESPTTPESLTAPARRRRGCRQRVRRRVARRSVAGVLRLGAGRSRDNEAQSNDYGEGGLRADLKLDGSRTEYHRGSLRIQLCRCVNFAMRELFQRGRCRGQRMRRRVSGSPQSLDSALLDLDHRVESVLARRIAPWKTRCADDRRAPVASTALRAAAAEATLHRMGTGSSGSHRGAAVARQASIARASRG